VIPFILLRLAIYGQSALAPSVPSNLMKKAHLSLRRCKVKSFGTEKPRPYHQTRRTNQYYQSLITRPPTGPRPDFGVCPEYDQQSGRKPARMAASPLSPLLFWPENLVILPRVRVLDDETLTQTSQPGLIDRILVEWFARFGINHLLRFAPSKRIRPCLIYLAPSATS
jgi:hypothetical protein